MTYTTSSTLQPATKAQVADLLTECGYQVDRYTDPMDTIYETPHGRIMVQDVRNASVGYPCYTVAYLGYYPIDLYAISKDILLDTTYNAAQVFGIFNAIHDVAQKLNIAPRHSAMALYRYVQQENSIMHAKRRYTYEEFLQVQAASVLPHYRLSLLLGRGLSVAEIAQAQHCNPALLRDLYGI